MTTTNLVARFSTTKNQIQLHAAGCSLVAALEPGQAVATIKGATIFPWTEGEAEDAAERGLKVTRCKCSK